ncbi:MAG: tetratricopeptide repeat protein [Deltaproteobacteria bacterium]|nr:tetratricopeptide repeat protein [Deltaproteobacteria bacterium]
MSRPILISILLVILTVGVFWRVYDHEFVWDDRIDIYENPHLKSDDAPEILVFWQKPYLNLYIPLTYTVWGTIARFSKVPPNLEGITFDPTLFHVANLIVHLVCVLIIFAILRLMVGNDWAAGGGALLFALHPLQVETVAWVNGMRDLLSGMLSFLALWLYVAYARENSLVAWAGSNAPAGSSESRQSTFSLGRGRLGYGLATLAYLLALLAKPSAVVVPAIAWFLDYWVVRRSMRESLTGLVPWIVLALPVVVVTQVAQDETVIRYVTPFWARPLVAGDSLAFYLYKLFVPLWLGPDYGRQPEWVLSQWWGYVMWLLPCALLVTVWLGRHARPWLLVAVGIFMVGILPVSGLVPFTFQHVSTVADRYIYLAMFGAAFALAWFLSLCRGRIVPLFTVAVMIWMAFASSVQSLVWRDKETLWRHALTVNDRSRMANFNLGNILAAKGDLESAIQYYLNAARIDPDSTDNINNLGNVYLKQGKIEQAQEQYQLAVTINPRDDFAYYNLARIFADKGERPEAIKNFERVLELKPSDGEAHYELGILLGETNDWERAIEHLRKALTFGPIQNPAKAHFLLATAHAIAGQFDEAINHYKQALRLRPDFAEAHAGIARALTMAGKREEAIPHYEQALEILKAGGGDSKPREQ